MNAAQRGFLEGLGRAIEVLEIPGMTFPMAIVALKHSKMACEELIVSENNNQAGE